MGTENSISNIINYSKNSQVNSELKINQNLIFKGGALNTFYSRLLYLVRTGVEFVNNAVPTYSSLRQVAEYNFALARAYATSAATISITNPSNKMST